MLTAVYVYQVLKPTYFRKNKRVFAEIKNLTPIIYYFLLAQNFDGIE